MHELAGRQRVGAAIVGLLGSIGVIAALIFALQREPGSDGAAGIESRDGRSVRDLPGVGPRVPEGRWLLQGSGEVAVLGADDESPLTWEVEGLWASDISPDGSLIVGVRSEFVTVSGEPGTTGGISLSPSRELVVGDIKTGELSVVASAAGNESFGTPVWSPDGRRILYSLAAWRFDIAPGAGHPGEPVTVTICILGIGDGSKRCFDDQVSDPRSYAWSPDGSRIIVSEGQRVLLLHLDTGEVSVAVDVTAPGEFRDGVLAAGLGEGVVLLDLSWSPSGEYVAGSLSTTTLYAVPVVFRLDGSIVAFGEPNGYDQHVVWSPTEDLLAYTVGEFDVGPGSQPWGVHLLDPSSGATESLWAVTGDDPRVFDVFWSPSGRWLALVKNPWGAVDSIQVLDLAGEEPIPNIVPVESDGEFVSLINWGTATA